MWQLAILNTDTLFKGGFPSGFYYKLKIMFIASEMYFIQVQGVSKIVPRLIR